MSRLLILPACLCAAALAAPASAQLAPAPSAPVNIHLGAGPFVSVGRDRPDRPHRRDRRDRATVLYDVGSPEGWAYYNNRTFAPDSFNDWWHDRPDRSLPRWVSQNSGCERQFWTGAGWRC